MKFALSAIALGISLACASQLAAAVVNVTISQQGTGNTAAADQSVGPNADALVTITQTGNDNHVGGPGGTTGGILQRVQSLGGTSNVTQAGTGNNVGIVQDVGGQGSSVNVTQMGNANSAIVNQVDSGGTDVVVRQAGTGNATNIRQSAGDSEIRVTQNGTNNSATVVEEGTGLFFGPIIEQNGEGNTVSATATFVGLSDHDIVQTGLRNHAASCRSGDLVLSFPVQQHLPECQRTTMLLYVDAQYASPYAMSVFVGLKEKGIPFDMQTLDLNAGANRSPEYAATSLTQRVPTLVDGDFRLSESSAITEYLDEVYPGTALYPAEPKAKARARQIQAWLRSDLLPIRQERSTEVVFYRPSNAPLSAAAEQAAQKLFKAAEALLAPSREHLLETWCIADVDLALMLNRLVLNGDAVPARLVDYAKRQWERASVQAWVSLPRPPL